MVDIPAAIPDVDMLVGLEPEELGAKLLFLFREDDKHQFHVSNLIDSLRKPSPSGQQVYPKERVGDVEQALIEAWAWLEAQGLLVPASGTNGQNGWCRLSRRAQRFENEAEFANYAVARLLPKELLHKSIAVSVWQAFMRGEFDMAVFRAMKAVEVSVRDAAGLPANLVGVSLMRKAFDKENGPLTDKSMEDAEREARAHLFAGAIGSYKNPQSHRDVNLENPQEATEIILLANHLLRIVESRSTDGAEP